MRILSEEVFGESDRNPSYYGVMHGVHERDARSWNIDAT